MSGSRWFLQPRIKLELDVEAWRHINSILGHQMWFTTGPSPPFAMNILDELDWQRNARETRWLLQWLRRQPR